MIECKVCDYLTCSLKPGNVECTVDDLVNKVIETFLLEDVADLFEPVAQNFMYEKILRFGDIQIKVPYEHNLFWFYHRKDISQAYPLQASRDAYPQPLCCDYHK